MSFQTVTLQDTFALEADAVIVAVPGFKPVTTPLLSTAATLGLEDFHLACSESLPESLKRCVFSVKMVMESVFNFSKTCFAAFVLDAADKA